MATAKKTTAETSNEDKNNDLLKANPQQIQQAQQSHSERFLAAVQREFEGASGEKVQLTNFQRKLIKNYFIKIDLSLKQFQQKNLMKSEQKRELAYDWNNVNLQKLALDVITYSAVGLDPLQPNHLHFIPYKNNSTGKYDLQPIMGYRGLEIKSMKYGLDVPDEVIIELVYEKDKFIPIKKDMKNKVESYIFEQSQDLNRGDIVGGFYYFNYIDQPQKNKLKTFSVADIEKRKPKYASVEFWGGEKDKWEWDNDKGKNVKVSTETVDGWYDEMCWKTIARAAYNSITIDSERIDENYLSIAAREQQVHDEAIYTEIQENANRKSIGFDMVDEHTGEVLNVKNSTNGNGNDNASGHKPTSATSNEQVSSTQQITEPAAEDCPI